MIMCKNRHSSAILNNVKNYPMHFPITLKIQLIVSHPKPYHFQKNSGTDFVTNVLLLLTNRQTEANNYETKNSDNKYRQIQTTHGKTCTEQDDNKQYSKHQLSVPSSKSSSSVCRGNGKQFVTSRHFLSTRPSRTPWTSSLPPAPSSWQCFIIFSTTCFTAFFKNFWLNIIRT